MIVYLMGGLGNQMFQYAFAKALEQRLCKVTGGAVKEMDNPHKVIISPKEFLHNPQTIHQTALITPKEWLTIPTS